jgi:serine/threonine protein kinase
MTLVAERYRLDEVLRRAAATTTYAGLDTRDQRPVVVKELRVAALGEWKEYDLFLREVKTLEAIRHPGIPRFLDHFTVESDAGARVYLVMERAPGEPLDARLERGVPTEIPEVHRVLRAVLEILGHLHGLAPPVIHRDVKPANIVVGPVTVYLVDFGGVRRFLPWAKGGSTVIGTFGYMAPEQLHGEATPVTDLYGLGATVAALLGGCDASELPRNGLRIDVSRIPAARPPLRAILEKLLEPEPSKRFASAGDVLDALCRPASEERALVPAPPPEPPAALPAAEVSIFKPSAFWARRGLLRWGLVGLGSSAVFAALGLEALRLLLWWGFLGELATGVGGLGALSVILGFLVKTRPACIRKILRMVRRRGGRVTVADAADRLRIPPERARELLEELVANGAARRDPAVAAVYWIGG